MSKTVILAAGGDLRQAYMCRELAADHKVYSWGIAPGQGDTIALDTPDQLTEGAEVLILPILSDDSLSVTAAGGTKLAFSKLIPCLDKGALVLGGRLRENQRKYFISQGLECEDYFLNESLVLRNCIPTAEGTVQIAMEQTRKTIRSSKVLIVGYGRTARACAALFRAVGADCTAAARRSSARAAAWTDGIKAISITDIRESIPNFDIVINTVPAMILDASVLRAAAPDSLVIDIASKPGGTDFGAAENLGINAVHALALPSKTAPATAGEIIACTVRDILQERRKQNV